MIHAGVIAIVAWGVLAFGAVYTWAYVPLLVACALVGLLALAQARRTTLAGSRWILIALAGTIVVAGLQLVPLPAAMLKAVSPGTHAFLQQYDLAYSVTAPAHPLSIAPRSTMVGLAFVAALGIFLAGLLRAFARSGVRRLVAAVVVLGAVVAVIAIVQKLVLGDHTYMGMKIYGFWTPESKLVVPFGPFVNRNHYAGWMLMVMPLAAGYLCGLLPDGRRPFDARQRLLWLSRPEGGAFVLTAFAIVIMMLSLVMSMSRSGMVGLAVAGALVGWRLILRLQTKRARLLAFAVLALLVLLPVAWLDASATVDRFSSDPRGSVQTRLQVWTDTLAVIRDFPLAGTGLNTFGTSMILYQTGNHDVHFQEAHSDYLQLAAEGGILLAIPLLVAVVAFVVAVRRRFAAGEDDWAMSWIRFGAVAGIVAIALQSLVEFSLQMPGNAAMFVVLLALALCERPRRSRVAKRS